VQVLDPTKWPLDITSPWIEGEQKLQALCNRLAVNHQKAQDGFRDHIDGERKNIPTVLLELTMADWQSTPYR